jgi:hypothetical protein
MEKKEKLALLTNTIESLQDAMSYYDRLPNQKGYDEDYFKMIESALYGIEN